MVQRVGSVKRDGFNRTMLLHCLCEVFENRLARLCVDFMVRVVSWVRDLVEVVWCEVDIAVRVLGQPPL